MSVDASRRADRWAILLASAALLAVAGAAAARHASPEWQRVQDAALREVAADASPEAAGRLERGLRQVWIPEIARADRCPTCHVGIEGGPDLAGLSRVARSHPRPDLLSQHPVERFGCTLCHGGDGLAVTAAAAHGEGHGAEAPMLSARRAREHALSPADLLQANCAACHRHAGAQDAMPRIAEARALVDKFRCRRCHVVDGRGGSLGPDLTAEAERSPEHLAFPEGWTWPRTAFAWHVAHFLAPTRMVPGTEMPDFGLTDAQARSLALLVASWRRMALPPAWTPGSPSGARK